MASATRPKDVFINCPFDDGFRNLFHAIIFAVVRSGFRPRCADEDADGTEPRIKKIERIIGECRYGIHDLSRTEADGDPPLPRFNMPLELGLWLGAKGFGGDAQAAKKCLVLDRDPHRYLRFISDIRGQDLYSHSADVDECIGVVATWLRVQSRRTTVPGGRRIAEEYRAFRDLLPVMLQPRGLEVAELKFNDFAPLAARYIADAL